MNKIDFNPQSNSYAIILKNKQSVAYYSNNQLFPVHNSNNIAFKGLKINNLRTNIISRLEGIKSKVLHKVVVVSGPSGVGKDTIISAVQKVDKASKKAVSYTTRPMRPSEVDGRDYYFISKEQFEIMDKEGKFFNQLNLNEKRYGGTVDELEAKRKGGNVFLNMSAEEAHKVKDIYGKDAILIFVKPPSIEELESRLIKRGTESIEEIKKRVNYGRQQIECASAFDKIIINSNLETAIGETMGYIKKRRSLVVKFLDTLIFFYKGDNKLKKLNTTL